MEACVAIYRMNKFSDDHPQRIGVVAFERIHYVDLDQVMVQPIRRHYGLGYLSLSNFEKRLKEKN